MSSIFSKYYQKTLLLVLLAISATFSSRATHLAAADIYVDYIGSGANDYKYRIVLAVYKSCEPGSIDLELSTNIGYYTPSGCGNTTPITIPVNSPKVDTLDQLCPNFKPTNSCRVTNSIFPAFVRHVWITTVTLPKACTDWTFFWTSGARNNKIINLVGPGGYNIYVDAGINNTKKANVSSPRYTVSPIPYLCQNAPAVMNNAPSDPDKDSMLTVNYQPRTTATGFCNYSATVFPFSLSNPVATPASNPYKVDPTTGRTTFTPTITGKFVVAFRSYKYDRQTGEQMGFTTRDVQISILPCNSPPPTIDTFPSQTVGGYFDTTNMTLLACPGVKLRFDISGTSQSGVNAIYADWDLSSTPGATYTTVGDGTYKSTGTFQWTPTKAQSGDYILSLKFKDSTCVNDQPLILESYYVVKIRVLPAVDGGPDGLYCPPSGAPWLMQTKVEPKMKYLWTTISGSPSTPPYMDNDTLARPSVKPNVVSRYQVLGSIYYGTYSCKTRDTVEVKIGTPLMTVSAGPDQVICANRSITLKGSTTPSSVVDSISWSPAYGLSDTLALNPVASPSITTAYALYAEDINGCGYRDTAKVIVDGILPVLAPFASRDTVCPEGSTQLYANVALQSCGIAQSSCVGGVPQNKTIGTESNANGAATPFYHTTNSGGERMQILYRRDELMEMGVKAGFINSLSFNVATKNTTDSFYKFTIKMGCVGMDELSGNTMTGITGISEVFPSRTVGTINGWNTFTFPNAYYWDGASNLVVEVCWSKVYGTYGGTPDEIYSSTTGYTSVKYIPSYTMPSPSMGEGCSLTAGTPQLSANRPNTRFNVCSTPSLFKYSWTPSSYLETPDSANTQVNGLKNDQIYTVKVTSLSNPNCFNSGTVKLVIDRTNSVTALPMSPYVVCRAGYITLDAQGNGPKPLRNLPCGTTSTVSCTTEDQIVVANPSNASIKAETVDHPFNGAYATAHTQYIIPRSALLNGKMRSGTIRSIALQSVGTSGMNFTNVKVSLKCVDVNQFASDAKSVVMETGTTQVYSASSYSFASAGYNKFTFNTPYNWDTTKNLLVDICYAGATPGTGPTINTYPTPGFFLMAKSWANIGDICVNPSGEVGPYSYETLPNFQISFCQAGDTEFTYSWTPGAFMSDTTLKSPTVYVDDSKIFYVSTRGRNGCKVRDSVRVFLPPHDSRITRDTAICQGESINLKSYNAYKTKWYESGYTKALSLDCDTCAVVIAQPGVTTDYIGITTDQYGCSDTFRVRITVKPLPNVRLSVHDTTLKYGASLSLYATGGTQYYWYPLAGLTNPNIVNPVVTPLVNTTYTVVGLGQNGCRASDSVKVTINYRSPVVVPTAFTPNGDGRNDKFRIAGVTFHSLMEFRVFNRWGQEVFSTTDVNGGWDGTWHGEKQDMGVYQYIIRVGYPDGYVETFKGDVTLLR